MEIVEKRFKLVQEKLSVNGILIHPNQLLLRAAKLWPHKTALMCEKDSITFGTLFNRAAQGAQLLRAKGVKKGDRVLILYENGIDFYVAYHAAWMTGALIAPLNVFLHEKELEHIVNDAQPIAILVSASLRPKVERFSDKMMILGIEDLVQPMLAEEGIDLFLSFDVPSLSLDECAVLLYTSGTTGLPKGVMLSGRAIMTNCIQGIACFDLSEDERIFAALPLFHSYMQNTSVWCALIVGAVVIVIPRINRKSLKEGLDQRPSIILAIPQLFGIFCLMRNLDFSSVKLIFSGGDALHSSTRLGFELLYGRRLGNGYGLTEAAPLVAANLEDFCAPAHCVGRPLLGIKVAIRDRNTHVELKSGEIGVLWVKGDNLMLGYYNAPEASASVLVDGWLNTGDLGFLTSEGFLVLAGREKDLIVNKGINIYPQEIETILVKHPHVLLAAVVGTRIGEVEVPVAYVTLAGEQASQDVGIVEEELKSLCREYLAPYKVPHRIFVQGSLPMTATGKVDKKVLRATIKSEAL
ncbi:TPA: hypothetical protein DDZ86_02675 [Candidatus Dependentiae bacterium]|nr:MAG: Long-chain fatty-acid-CoA ligase [candidate division TM6 bacterium GW2011_GWF2_43_87]HBL98523.1 hypothetical protein [Candidatus Dependentiae bacterium]